MLRSLQGVIIGGLAAAVAGAAAAQVPPLLADAAAQVVPPADLQAISQGLAQAANPAAASQAGQGSGPTTGAAQALSLDELQQETGRQGVTIITGSTQNLTAVNSGNTLNANQIGSGDITLTEGAFAGFAGVGNFVINSGHNNNLQGSLSIILAPTP